MGHNERRTTRLSRVREGVLKCAGPPGLSPPFVGGVACLLSPGLHKITPPPQDITPGVTFSNRKKVIPGVCYLV